MRRNGISAILAILLAVCLLAGCGQGAAAPQVTEAQTGAGETEPTRSAESTEQTARPTLSPQPTAAPTTVPTAMPASQLLFVAKLSTNVQPSTRLVSDMKSAAPQAAVFEANVQLEYAPPHTAPPFVAATLPVKVQS